MNSPYPPPGSGPPGVPGVAVVAELGRGAHSVVYRVRRDGEELAMKILHGSFGADRRALAQFHREAALLALADHPGLPTVHDVGEAQGRPYLIMDLNEGHELAEALRAGPLSEDQIVDLGIQVADMLAAIHRVGLVHRDVKPQNILLQADGSARIIDLGMATRSANHRSEIIAGTLTYCAPEQAGTLKRPVDARCDLYSLGVVLYECAAGRVPFTSSDVGELLRMHASAPPPDLRLIRADLSPILVEIIEKLLAKDPDDRYGGCQGLIADLRRAGDEPTARFPLGLHDQELNSGRLAGELVGRDPELASLLALWRRVRWGQGGVALISGGSGIGKTRLAAEFAGHADRSGAPVLSAVCVQGANPLAALTAAIERYLNVITHLDPVRRAEATHWIRTATGDHASPYLNLVTPGLAALLPDAGQVPEVQKDGVVWALGAFLAGLARAAGGAVLIVDDAQWLDGATSRVLEYLASQLAGSPLLIVTAIDDTRRRTDATARFLAVASVELELPLGPLDRDARVRLVRGLAGRLALDPRLLERIVARGGGSPLGLREYFSAVLDAGLILPRWGTWILDVAGLDHIDLPKDVLGLLQRRIDGLGRRSRKLLTAAATIGMRFTPATPAWVSGMDLAEAQRLLDQAATHGLLDKQDGEFSFVHDRARRALLDGIPPDRLCDLHQRAAEVMIKLKGDSVMSDYALARHLARGHPDRNPGRVFRVCMAAGRRALAEHAATEAVDLLQTAAGLAGAQSAAVRSELHELLGTAYHTAGQLTEAAEELEMALETAPDPLARARILNQLGRLHLAAWRLDLAEEAACRALVAVGKRLPRNSVWLALSSTLLFLGGVFIERTGLGFGTRDPDRIAHFKLVSSLYSTAAHAAVRMLRPGHAILLGMRGRYFATRLGSSLEYVRILANTAAVARLVTGRPTRRRAARATRAATSLRHPAGVVYSQYIQRLVEIQTGDPDPEEYLDWIERNGALLDASELIDFTQSLCGRFQVRGRSLEAMAASQRGVNRLAAVDLSDHPLGQAATAVAASTGRLTDVRENLRLLDLDTPAARSLGGRLYMLNGCATLAVEQREFGEIIDRIGTEFDRLRIRPSRVIPTFRLIYANLAYARLEQARVAANDDRPQALEAAARAVRGLRRAARGPGPCRQLRLHYLVARAHLLLLRGNANGALDLLGTLDRLLCRDDVPWAAFEAARVRARALTTLGRTLHASAQAAGAMAIAEGLGWPHRTEWIRGEFTISGTGLTRSMGSSTTNGLRGSDRRRLAALERLSITASRILDPDELTRVALDETINMLAAERAYVFLTDAQQSRLIPHLGRDSSGHDLAVLTNYGSTVVERVRQGREPVIVTGTDDGAALGSQSVVVHGLRSIIAAPLQFDGRLLGVVYLDSRVAKGIFTPADVGILTAITNHIAAALETARAAQLAVAVQAAEQQRDVANKLRAAMVELSSSLDPDDVLDRLHVTLTRLLPADSTALVRFRDDKLLVRSGTNPEMEPQLVAPDPVLDMLLFGDSPVAGPGSDAPREPMLFGDWSPYTSWLAVPLRDRSDAVGAIVLSAWRPEAYGDAEIQVAAALAGEAMVAYDNARLFAQVQRMATTDALTEVANRRHFFALAEADVSRVLRSPHRMTAMMLDIDHFKRINDEFGHHIGDQVIQVVAKRLRQTVRESDRLGRYGGEEFAILLPELTPAPVDLGERMREAIAYPPIETDAGPLPVTISVGVCVFQPQIHSLTDALNRADAAMYLAKQDGRNRVRLDVAS